MSLIRRNLPNGWGLWSRVSQQRTTGRLLCTHHAGGWAGEFKMWVNNLPPTVDLHALEPPAIAGADHTFEWLMTGALAAFEPLLDLPPVIYGHGTGALLAYELARFSQQELARPVRRLVVASCHAPGALADDPNASDAALRAFGRDVRLAATYQFRPGFALTCPITVMGGRMDAGVRAADLNGWAEMTSARCEILLFDGGHFFTRTHRNEILRSIARVLP